MTQEHSRERDALEERTREVFDRSVADLDAATRSRLTRARHRALRALERPAIAPSWQAWGSQAAAAALVVITLGVGWRLLDLGPAASPVGGQVADVDDFELLLGEDELELIEDLDFYAWLEEQPEFQSGDDAGAG